MTSRRSPVLRQWTRAMVVAITVGGVALSAVPAYAAWSASGSGQAAGAATIMPSGHTPSATAGTGSATVSWSAAILPNGTPVGGYLIRRYDAATKTLQVVHGTCAGVVTTTSCTDTSVSAGTWVYTDTPVLNSWTGLESSYSAAVAVS